MRRRRPDPDGFRFAHPILRSSIPRAFAEGTDHPRKEFNLRTARALATFPTAVSAVDEQKKIEHQIELATRAAALVKDETTGQRFRSFAEELKRKLRRMMGRGQVRARAYELWEQAGRPSDRELEFWLEAERQVEEEREERKGAGGS